MLQGVCVRGVERYFTICSKCVRKECMFAGCVCVGGGVKDLFCIMNNVT